MTSVGADAQDRADARAAVREATTGRAEDCQACGEAICAEDRLSAPDEPHCGACRQALALTRRTHRSRFCNL